MTKISRARSTYGQRKDAYRVWWGNLRGEGHLEEPGVDETTALKYIFEKWNKKA